MSHIAAATVLLPPFLAPDLLLWTCIGCLCGQPFDHFHLLAYFPCCDHMSAHIFSNRRACRDYDERTSRIPWVQGRGTQPGSSAWKPDVAIFARGVQKYQSKSDPKSTLCRKQKCSSKVVEAHQSSHCNPSLCYDWEAALLIWHFMENGICFKFDASHHTVMVLLVLEACIVVQINHTGATIEVEVARCKNCSSKLCLSFDPFQPRSLQQKLRTN